MHAFTFMSNAESRYMRDGAKPSFSL